MSDEEYTMRDDSSYEYDSASGDELSDCEFFASTATDGFGVRMLPVDELGPVMNDQIRETAEVLGAPPGAAAILLREHEWEKERLFQSFFNDPDRVKEKCGVLARCRHSGDAGRNTRVTGERRICEICMDEDGFNPDEMIGMPCGHEFCETCWYGFISSSLEKGPHCVRETCPQAGCNELVTEEEVRRAVPDLLPKFERYQLQSFVEMCGMTRWCPGPGCGQVALACGGGMFSDIGGDAKCNVCETAFCLKCGEEPHAPITCQHLSKWQEKCKDESETSNWILANTKACPKCLTRIEKNQGCNHMTCANCSHEFCWLCFADWYNHTTATHSGCNGHDPHSFTNGQSDVEMAKSSLHRYLHYYKRFHSHSQAQDFVIKSVKETDARVIHFQEKNPDAVWIEAGFLEAANRQLVECRRVLKYSYAFAYYLQDGDKKTRFEYHQLMLERFTKNLSEHTEKPIQDINRTEVVNQTRVVDGFITNILTCVNEGMED